MSEPFDFSIFDSFEDEFTPQKSGFRTRIEDLPVGDYDVSITSAAFDHAGGKPILRMILQIIGGTDFEHVYWLERQEGVNSLGADLVVLGFNIDQEKKAGKKLAAIFATVQPRLTGIKFRAKKVERKDTRPEKKGVVYHDLKIIARLSGNPPPAQSAPTFNEFAGSTPSSPSQHSKVPF